MATKTFSQLPDGKLFLKPDSFLAFEEDGVSYNIDPVEVSKFSQGTKVTKVKGPDDLPPLLNGFQMLEQNQSYDFIEPNSFPNKILFPPGYIGQIRQTFLSQFDTVYTGTGAFFNTLNIDGSIASVADAGGGNITVTTSTPHGILDGQYVNIFGTTSYNQERLLVSNASGSVFDVSLAFVADETGSFDTGYSNIQMPLFKASNSLTANFMDMTATRTGNLSSFLMNRVALLGFISPGILRNAQSFGVTSSLLGYIIAGLTLENCVGTGIHHSRIEKQVPGIPSIAGTGLTFTGPLTTDQVITTTEFIMTAATQHPIRLDSSLGSIADIRIKDSPDNDVATDYYDTSSGGLDQTDPRVIAKANASRANSMSSAQVGFTNIATPIVVTITTQDIPVIIGGTQFLSSNLERATTTTAGQITNTTKVTKKYPITFSALIEKVGGGSTDIGLLLIVNGVLDLSATFDIPHSVNAGIIQISATRDFELAETDTIDIAVVNFDGTANISVSQANISYSVET